MTLWLACSSPTYSFSSARISFDICVPLILVAAGLGGAVLTLRPQQSERGAQWQEEAELGRKGREEKGREQSWMNRREGRYVVILPPDSSASGQLGERQLERAKSKKAELEGGAEERTSCRWRA